MLPIYRHGAGQLGDATRELQLPVGLTLAQTDLSRFDYICRTMYKRVALPKVVIPELGPFIHQGHNFGEKTV